MNVVVLHGSFGSPSGNWFPWAVEAWKDGVAVSPFLPTPDYQTFDVWASILDSYLEIPGFKAGGVALVAHSSGAAFAARYVVERQLTVDVFVAVAGFAAYDSGNEEFDGINAAVGIDAADLPKLVPLAKRRIAIYSDNDPYLPGELLEAYASGIEAERTVIPGAGHVNAESGVTEFPLLLELLG